VQPSFETATETISDWENVGRHHRTHSAGISRRFRHSYLKANKITKTEAKGQK